MTGAPRKRCPLDCGQLDEARTMVVEGVSVVVCPECEAVAFDGGRLTDPRFPKGFLQSLRQSVEHLRHENSIDPLTQVKNRRYFFNRLRAELTAARHRYFVSLVAFGCDVQALYERLGARAGDAVVQSVAAALLAAVRTGDDYARVEPGVFGMILRNADAEAAQAMVERVLGTLPRRFYDHESRPVEVKLWAGAQTVTGDQPDSEWQQLVSRLRKTGNGQAAA